MPPTGEIWSAGSVWNMTSAGFYLLIYASMTKVVQTVVENNYVHLHMYCNQVQFLGF